MIKWTESKHLQKILSLFFFVHLCVCSSETFVVFFFLRSIETPNHKIVCGRNYKMGAATVLYSYKPFSIEVCVNFFLSFLCYSKKVITESISTWYRTIFFPFCFEMSHNKGISINFTIACLKCLIIFSVFLYHFVYFSRCFSLCICKKKKI